VIECAARLEGGVLRANVRALLEALGYQVYDHVRDQGKVYVRRS